ncbi:MAG: hypothetical protein OEQ13_00145 [Acidobacteriota bacterium]|nr:hypothetical protein [Acidobacteriota bacterium]
MGFRLGPRRGTYIDISEDPSIESPDTSSAGVEQLTSFDLVYRSLCAILYNYVPQSGHPGGSISSGRFVAALLFDTMDYDLSDPDRDDADVISYAAGHKALGLYALWALRDEAARIAAPELLPGDERKRLRLDDLLGFRRNPVTNTPLFLSHQAKALDGHPTPATPFVKLSTGASGVGIASSLGLALGLRDQFGKNSPAVHVVEGEGGLTPGRVAEALAAAGTMGLDNAVVHVDWNQASIDSDRVCRDGEEPGEYVQWTPMELFLLHDWNVIFVPDGTDLTSVLAAQRRALTLDSGQPTAIVYSTVKGWEYGIEGRASHGAGHKLCSRGFFHALEPLTSKARLTLPHCETNEHRCEAPGAGGEVMEQCFWEALLQVRKALEDQPGMLSWLTGRLRTAAERLSRRRRVPREGGPNVAAIYELAEGDAEASPAELTLTPGATTTLRAELGRALGRYNDASGGALFAAAADLLGSTSVNLTAGRSDKGYYHAARNPGARLLSIGGICEDAIAGYCSGLSTFGRHIGVASSYGAFIAPLGHIAARLHAIGSQARRAATGRPYDPMILICAHAGLKTGEDGPTHADPQPLQLLSENFPPGTMVTLTPWDPQEISLLLATALLKRPAVICPFVTRPNEMILDREAHGLAPVAAARSGVYLLRAARGPRDGTVVLQESGVTYAFLEDALPLIEREGIELDVYYVASAELFDLLPAEEQERIFPASSAGEAMGITGFTLPTMYRWIRSERGRAMTLHPYQKGHFLGSGEARYVLEEAGLDGESQYRAVKRHLVRAA